MLIEIDQVAIESKLWARVLAGDVAAKAQVRAEVNGLELYLHALSVSSDTHTVVTLRQLDALNLIDWVRCGAHA